MAPMATGTQTIDEVARPKIAHETKRDRRIGPGAETRDALIEGVASAVDLAGSLRGLSELGAALGPQLDAMNLQHDWNEASRQMLASLTSEATKAVLQERVDEMQQQFMDQLAVRLSGTIAEMMAASITEALGAAHEAAPHLKALGEALNHTVGERVREAIKQKLTEKLEQSRRAR